jgi:hypothetical protein
LVVLLGYAIYDAGSDPPDATWARASTLMPDIPEIEKPEELEERSRDSLGQKVGVLAAVLAAFLAVVTILSHRAHTTAVVERTEANDQWSFYQSKRIKFHSLELGIDMLGLLGKDKPGVEEAVKRYEVDKAKEEKDYKEIQAEARQKEDETRHTEDKALRYDVGEGMLEIGVVLSSLFFIARRKLFPVVALLFGLGGIVMAVTGLLL